MTLIHQNLYLLVQLIRRDLMLRYRGSIFGVLWMLLHPLIMLTILAVVSATIFQTRWPYQDNSVPFWLTLYAGLIVFNLFSETLLRSPAAVRSQPNYVKKMIFPVELLPIVSLGSAIVQAGFNLIVMVVALAWTGNLSVQILWLPVLLLPLILFTLGVAWFVSAWGVFIKDISQIMPVVLQMLLFLSPILYPVSAVPSFLQPLYQYNPLAIIIEISRAASTGLPIMWASWFTVLLPSLLICWLGYQFFMRAREEFADVL